MISTNLVKRGQRPGRSIDQRPSPFTRLSNFPPGVCVTWKPRRDLMTLPSHVLQRGIQTSTNCLVPLRTRFICTARVRVQVRIQVNYSTTKGHEYFQVLNVCLRVAVCPMFAVPTKCSTFLRCPISYGSTKPALMEPSAFSRL